MYSLTDSGAPCSLLANSTRARTMLFALESCCLAASLKFPKVAASISIGLAFMIRLPSLPMYMKRSEFFSWFVRGVFLVASVMMMNLSKRLIQSSKGVAGSPGCSRNLLIVGAWRRSAELISLCGSSTVLISRASPLDVSGSVMWPVEREEEDKTGH